jgi:hypothetical protein
MSTATIDEGRLKALLKSAIVEVLEERKDLMREAVDEALEDIALVRAIEEGVRSGKASRQEVFAIFEEEIEG